MGTFHHDKHALHGITIVVETDGPELVVGRCHDIDERGVTLRDADVHHAAESTITRQAYLEAAGRVGVWPRHKRLFVPAERIREVRRLADS